MSTEQQDWIAALANMVPRHHGDTRPTEQGNAASQETVEMTQPHYEADGITLYYGDCLDVMAAFADNSIDAIVTDPPYGLGFMGKAWDALPPGLPWAKECLRVLKPGGHLLAFGGTRTWHRLAVAVEDAGFEIRDSIAWLYGSGFPKSLDVSKAIDKRAGATREVIGEGAPFGAGSMRNKTRVEMGYRPTELNPAGGASAITVPATDDAATWQGWGTALKPAFEPIVMSRKPLVGTVAANILAHGTGALNVDASRVAYASETDAAHAEVPQPTFGTKASGAGTYNYRAGEGRNGAVHDVSKGRWPANVLLDDDQAAALDEQSGNLRGFGGGGATAGHMDSVYEGGFKRSAQPLYFNDSGGASRFFPTFKYQAKAPTRERPKVDGVSHPTVKPLELMRWLVRLVTPPDGVVLDPFAGSGTTLEAATLEGFRAIGIEQEGAYLPLIEARLEKSQDCSCGNQRRGHTQDAHDAGLKAKQLRVDALGVTHRLQGDAS